MRRFIPVILLAAIARASEPGTTSWATVPASLEAGRIEAFPVPGGLGDGVITLIGARSSDSTPKQPSRVLGLDLVMSDRSERATSAVQEHQVALPPEAILPGPDGRIRALGISGMASRTGLRNPWEVRVRPHLESREFVFTNGGVIAGGAGGPVALVNGHIVLRGSVIDGFEVALITYSAVVISRDGASYVLPLGRRVAIEVTGA